LLISFVTTAVLALTLLKGSEALFSAMGWATAGVADVSEWILSKPHMVIAHLTLTGGLLWWVESRPINSPASPANAQALASQADTLRVTTWQAVRVGLFQTMAAILHGVSRSGSTITGGMLNGWNRATAAKYSFLLSIPTFLAAMVYECLKLMHHRPYFTVTDLLVMLGAALVSGLVGYLCIGWFIPYLSRASLKGFALYCWGVVALMLVVLR
jgi:undecaprenyl pyrophosphate phosphatase UppP